MRSRQVKSLLAQTEAELAKLNAEFSKIEARRSKLMDLRRSLRVIANGGQTSSDTKVSTTNNIQSPPLLAGRVPRSRTDWAESLLIEFGRPMRIPEMIDVFFERGKFLEFKGKRSSLLALFSSAIAGSKRFFKVKSGFWWLADYELPKDWDSPPPPQLKSIYDESMG